MKQAGWPRTPLPTSEASTQAGSGDGAHRRAGIPKKKKKHIAGQDGRCARCGPGHARGPRTRARTAAATMRDQIANPSQQPPAQEATRGMSSPPVRPSGFLALFLSFLVAVEASFLDS